MQQTTYIHDTACRNTITTICYSSLSTSAVIAVNITTGKCLIYTKLAAAKKEKADFEATLDTFLFDEERAELAALTEKCDDLFGDAQKIEVVFAEFAYKVYNNLLISKEE